MAGRNRIGIAALNASGSCFKDGILRPPGLRCATVLRTVTVGATVLVAFLAPASRPFAAAGEAVAAGGVEKASALERAAAPGGAGADGSAAGGAPAPKGGSEWPRYRGSNGDAVVEDAGIVPADLAAGFRKLWSVPLPDEPSADTGPSYARYNTYSGPIVAGGRVYAPSKVGKNDVLSCLDAATGKLIWRHEFEVPVLKKEYGTGMRATPCVHGDYVYILSYWGHLSCLRREDGSLAWRRNLVEEYKGKLPPFGASASPVVLDGKLIVLPGGPGAAVAALDPATGRELWKSGDGEPAYATPEAATVCGVRQILAFIAPGLVAFDAATGRELWRYDYPEDWRKNIAAPIIVGDIVYIANRTLGVTALRISFDGNAWGVSKLWTSRKEKMHFASPVIGDGCIFYHDGKRSIRCLDLSSGSLLWAEPDLGSQWAGMVRLGRFHLLAATDDGHINLLEVSRNACRRIVRFQAFGTAFVQPAVAGGRLYVQDFKE
ncbi:MAG: PQQ-like beta-propeller repeat protein, partial [Planctomycetota bacterium]|nr:PQQ-like beta-propeller repeat protein [Planctomycetota bacterium]